MFGQADIGDDWLHSSQSVCRLKYLSHTTITAHLGEPEKVKIIAFQFLIQRKTCKFERKKLNKRKKKVYVLVGSRL